MPAEVGAGTFWSGMVDWVSGEDIDTVLQDIEDSWPDGDTGIESTGSSDDTADTGGFEYLTQAENGDFDGTEVTIFAKWTEGEEEKFVNTLADFEERTGIDIVYNGSSEFETLVAVQVEGGDPPDIAGFPQPGLMAEFVESGDLIDFGSLTNVDELNNNYSDAWINLGTVDGQLSGVFFRASTKSIVWYPVAPFEEAGYEIPQTWDDMLALSDQIVADQGVTPWCVSILHEGVTGWVATDWLEDILLRTASPEIYDQWVTHEIPFNHPEVLEAAAIMGDLWFNDEYVYGGTDGILNIFVGDTQTPMFEDPPQCWFHRQAGWIPDFWPEGTEAGVDSSFFYLPPIESEYGNPVLGAGDVFAAFSDRPEVLAVMEYLASADSAKGWLEAGGFISPNSSVPIDWYGSYVDQAQAEILANATTLRFDASDLMPAEVGAGTFWSGMVDWVSGDDVEEVFQSIEDSWPEE
ncbi:MAG: carbohydrate ABC transporter substrate-binding protein [Chloroflexi bacterium]|nr:carbohydrate ABC transporter substrate-binding protein [Chloroflexota bacterium]